MLSMIQFELLLGGFALLLPTARVIQVWVLNQRLNAAGEAKPKSWAMALFTAPGIRR